MKALKWIVISLIAYAGLVMTFESLLGTLQPAGGGTLVITTTDASGTTHDRVVSRLESGGRLYVAANHWPRAWYRRALDNPTVRVALEGASGDYEAVPVTDAEHISVNRDNELGLVFRVLTGFPPRYFLRLDPL
ncbi:MAG: nitroreductase family deazaflavin-dependent oxidoreductase [Gemmatimonadota bacterium]|nr:nitroreductase family deazaflavin-dependent oxidoreductase [Gemmatimonadota bacterium]